MTKYDNEPPLRKWQYIFTAIAIFVSAIGAAGIWYGSANKDKQPQENTELDEPRDRVNCSVVAEDVYGSNLSVNVGQAICSE
jgi:hypothetical protein